MTYIPRLEWLNTSVLAPPAITHAKSDEWNDQAGMSGPINSLDASWTPFGASQSRAYANGKLILTGTAAGSVTPNVTGMYKAQPSTPYTVTCEVALDRHTNYNFVEVGFSDSSGTMKLWGLCLAQDPVANTDEYRRTFIAVNRYASVTSRTSNTTPFVVVARRIWLRVTNDGSNCIALWSPTGVEGTFEQVVSESYATALLTPTRFWIGVDPFSTNIPVAEFGPVRVT